MQGEGPPLSTVCAPGAGGGLNSRTARGTSDRVKGGHGERAITTRALLLALVAHALLVATLMAVPRARPAPVDPATVDAAARSEADTELGAPNRFVTGAERARPSAAPPGAFRGKKLRLLESKVL